MNDIASIESLIDEYVASHGLEHGSALPPLRELAAEFACDEGALIRALRASEKKRKVTYNEREQLAKLADYHDRFSFAKSAEAHRRKLTTELIEKSVRLPTEDSEGPFFGLERQAQEALGLGKNKKLLVIARVRLLEGRPSVFQRAYLNPARFPRKFLSSHDFERESLIDVYHCYGYKLLSRDTTLAARGASLYETNMLMQKYHLEGVGRTVLDAEQKLYAQHPKIKKERFVLEFLKASYLEDWKYEIKNRPFS